MYPNLYYAFKDLFNVEWPFLRFVNSFGFFVALSFILSAMILTHELKRKGKEGLMQPTDVAVVVGKPASVGELIMNFLLGFLLGYKILALFIMDRAVTEDPQAFIFSGIGSWPAGIILGLLFAGLKWYEKNKQKLPEPEKRIIRIWPHDRVGEITIYALVFGLAGAKLFDIFENWSDFLQHPSAYIFSPAGLTFYGGLICAGIAITLYAKKHKIGVLHLVDAMAPTMMFAYAIGRIGCQVSGDGDWGIANTRPNPYNWLPDWMWSYNFPHNVNEDGIKIPGCVGKYCYELPVGHYPTSFYEIVICLILFLVIWAFRKKLKIPGTLFAFYLILNGLERFFIEKIRVNNKLDLFGLHPTQAEVISSLLIITGIILWFILHKKFRKIKA
jgi:Prolipoprotein diacylglyceryltransferase